MFRENDDIYEVYEAEKRRGRRPVNPEEKRRIERFKQGVRNAIATKDERAFLNALREAGVMDGTEEFAKALRFFRAQIGRR